MSSVAATIIPIRRPTASHRLSSRFHIRTLKTAMARNMSVPSRRIVRSRDTTGATRAADPSTSVRFAVFDPTTLPSAMSISPRPAASPDTSISGADVPTNPMTSAPMRIGDNPRAEDTLAADTTNRSAASVSSTRPAMRNRTERIIGSRSYRCPGSDLPPTR